jgi:hypothetical protein
MLGIHWLRKIEVDQASRLRNTPRVPSRTDGNRHQQLSPLQNPVIDFHQFSGSHRFLTASSLLQQRRD